MWASSSTTRTERWPVLMCPDYRPPSNPGSLVTVFSRLRTRRATGRIVQSGRTIFAVVRWPAAGRASKEDVMTQERRVQLVAGTVGMLIVAALLLATVVDAAAQGPLFGRGGPDGFIGAARGGRGGGLGLMR